MWLIFLTDKPITSTKKSEIVYTAENKLPTIRAVEKKATTPSTISQG